jgi:hypothetical protein
VCVWQSNKGNSVVQGVRRWRRGCKVMEVRPNLTAQILMQWLLRTLLWSPFLWFQFFYMLISFGVMVFEAPIRASQVLKSSPQRQSMSDIHVFIYFHLLFIGKYLHKSCTTYIEYKTRLQFFFWYKCSYLFLFESFAGLEFARPAVVKEGCICFYHV